METAALLLASAVAGLVFLFAALLAVSDGSGGERLGESPRQAATCPNCGCPMFPPRCESCSWIDPDVVDDDPIDPTDLDPTEPEES